MMSSENIEEFGSKDFAAQSPPTLLSQEPRGSQELSKRSDDGQTGWRGAVTRLGQSLKDKGVEDRGIVPRPEDVGLVGHSAGWC